MRLSEMMLDAERPEADYSTSSSIRDWRNTVLKYVTELIYKPTI